MNAVYMSTLYKIAVFWVIAVITPGPNFLVSVNTSIQYGKKDALYTVLGIVAGTAIWTVSGFLGISMLFILAPWLFKLLKIAGAVYLISLGIGKFFIKSKIELIEESRNCSDFSHFRKGLMVNLSNPKTAIFISSLFATLVPQNMGITIKFASFLTLLFISLTWYSFVSLIFSNKGMRKVFEKNVLILHKIAGIFYILLGIKTLFADTGLERNPA